MVRTHYSLHIIYVIGTQTQSSCKPSSWWIIGGKHVIPPSVTMSYAQSFHLHRSDDEPPLTPPLWELALSFRG